MPTARVSNSNTIFWGCCVLPPLINLDRHHPMVVAVVTTTMEAAIWNAWEMYLILAYYRPMSNDRIRCRSRATHRFGCNDVFGIWAAVATFDAVDGDEMAAVEWLLIQLNRAQIPSPAQPVMTRTARTRNNPNTPNRWTGPTAVYGSDFHPSIGVRMRAIVAENGNSVICPAYVNALMRMPLQS